MRAVVLPGTDLLPAPLGMGCASLGSRYGSAEGLRALAAAADRGVTWFDVAPAYGAGEAEVLLGRFLSGRRERVQLCTKVGLLPPRLGRGRSLLMSVARPLIGQLKGLRRAVRRSGTTTNHRVPLTPELIEGSISRSLRRLGTDRVEVYALHNPTPDDLRRDEVLRALEQVVVRGQARYLGVAGDLAASLAGVANGRFQVAQLADDPVMRGPEHIRATGPTAIVTHSVLGLGGAHELLTKRLSDQPDLMEEARDAGFDGAAALLMARAFASNPQGVVLASMFGRGNLQVNAAAAELPPERAESAAALVNRCIAAMPLTGSAPVP